MSRSRWLAGPPERHHVLALYRSLLGREPESEAVIAAQIEQAATVNEVRARIMASTEFRAGLAPDRRGPLPIPLPPAEIDTDASAEELAALLARMDEYWSRIGEEAPHWSVLTEERFRPERITEAKAAFYGTGGVDEAILAGILRAEGARTGDLRCVEFGCGVGRVTLRLSPLFAEVVGCDISAPHLAVAREEAAARGLHNLVWHRTRAGRLMPDGGWDVWFSRLVLQHNPPPVMMEVLRRAFDGLRPGGLAVFQVPTWGRGYRFDLRAYLSRGGPPGMELHALPMRAVCGVAREAGLEGLDVREDGHMAFGNTADWLSNLFVFRRPG